MDSYAARLICAAAMIGAAALSATLFSNAQERTAERKPSGYVTWEETQTYDLAEKENEPQYYVVLRSSQLQEGDTVSLYDASGSDAGQATADATGEATLGPLPSGVYQTWNETLGAVCFHLQDNASIEAISGNGWTDGEILYLTGGVTASMELVCQARLCSQKTQITTLTLQSSTGQTTEQSICFTPEEGENITTRTCLFSGLAPGSYALLVDGSFLQTVTVSQVPEENAVTLWLGEYE